MIFWNTAVIAKHMNRRGLANPNQLSEFAGLTIPTAYNVLSGAPLDRIYTSTLETLGKAFGLKKERLLALLLHVPDDE